MKNRILLIIAVTFLITLFLPATVYAETTFREASIDDFTGTVKVCISGGQKEYSAYRGMGLTQGDTVITGESSSVTLYIDDDKEVVLGANSRLTLSELSNYTDSKSKSTGLKLWVGQVWVNVKKKLNIRSKFEITTGSTVMGVKGTKFYVAYEPTDDKNEKNGEIRSQSFWGNSIRYNTTAIVLEGTVAATLYSSPPSGSGGPPNGGLSGGGIGGSMPTTVDIHSGQLAFFSGLQGMAPPPPVPINPQSLPLLVLQQIAQNPQEFDSGLRQNLQELLRQRQAEEDRLRNQRMLEQQQRELQERQITYLDMLLNPNSGNDSTQQSGPTSIPGNETVSITSPTAAGAYNTQCDFTISMTATNHENDLKSVKVSLKRGSQYYDNSSGLFHSATPVYMNAVKEGSNWVLNMSSNTWVAFKNEDEFDCVITAIANDGVDGTETTVTFHVDNIKPELTSLSEISRGIYPDQITGELHDGRFTFSEIISDAGRTNVVNAIKSKIISDNDNLSYTWSSTSNYPQTLTLNLTSQSGGEVLFNDTADMSSTISDMAGNRNTVKLFDVRAAAVTGSAIDARNVYVKAASGAYITPNSEFRIALPVDSFFNNSIVLDSDNINKYVTLDGVLNGCTIESITRDTSGDYPTFIVTLVADQNGNIIVPEPGEGTITFSRQLWSGSGPLRISINFTETGLSLTKEMIDGPLMMKLQWQTQSETTGATVYVSTTSENGPYTAVDDSQSLYSNTQNYAEGIASVSGLIMNQDYWFRVFLSGGDTAGYTKAVHYRPGDIEDMNLYIANANEIPLYFGEDMATYECVANNDNVSLVYNAENSTHYVVGRKVGSAEVTVTDSSGISRSFTVTVLPTEITEVDASPNLVVAEMLTNELGIRYQEYFYVALPQGEFGDLNYSEAMYNIILDGALVNGSVIGLENTDLANKAMIYLATETDDFYGSYIPVSESSYAYIVLSDVLWGGAGDKAVRARIQVSIGAN